MLLNILSTAILIIVSSLNKFCHLISSEQVPNSDYNCLNNQTCGHLQVSYPFSLITTECPSFNSSFKLDCKSGGQLYLNNATYKAIYNTGASSVNETIPLQVIEFGNSSLIVDITSLRTVPNSAANQTCPNYGIESSIELPGPYLISGDNKFGSFGCNTFGVFFGMNYSNSQQYGSFPYDTVQGCDVSCPGAGVNNSDCGNHECCVSSLPSGSIFSRVLYSSYSLTSNGSSNSCSSNYSSLFYPNSTDFDKKSYHLKLDWALPSNQSIHSFEKATCSSNSTAITEVPGYYRCSCNVGYSGDGYSKGFGCTDVDECKLDFPQNDCIPGKTTCQNTEGSYTCKCKLPFHVGDGRRQNGSSGCGFSPKVRNAFVISGVGLGLALLMGVFILLAIWWRQRRLKTRRKYFMQNGGLQLQAYIAAAGGRETTRLFNSEELKVATDNYSDQMKLGVGGFGTVFKGILEDGRVVAIKKANSGGDGDNEQFLNEMAILTQINHRHIVRLLGCCLETSVPLLVYEYVSNGNVAENLESQGPSVMGWKQRLKVATQTAEALAYLHAAASPPILHRDVKSANVLLDDNLDAKLADFGVSRLIPEGVQHVSTAVQGTLGYLDPEYFQTLQLTDKSDVYSFGVMLVELITALRPVDSRNREPRFANLALLFIDRMQDGRSDELIDPRLENPSNQPTDVTWRTRSSIMAVATLARRCLTLRGTERPSMSHVADELRGITQFLHNADEDDDEALPLLPSKQLYDHEAGAVVAAPNAQYYVQSGCQFLNVPTMPR